MRVENISVGPAVLEVVLGGSGDTVILLPYAGGDVAQFDRFAPVLHEAGFQTVAINPRGVSESIGPLEIQSLHDLAAEVRSNSALQSLHDLAADVAGVISALGPATVHVLGASFGTRIARCLAADRPDLVRTVILVGAVGLVTSNDPEAVDRSPHSLPDRCVGRRVGGGGSACVLLSYVGLEHRAAVQNLARRPRRADCCVPGNTSRGVVGRRSGPDAGGPGSRRSGCTSQRARPARPARRQGQRG